MVGSRWLRRFLVVCVAVALASALPARPSAAEPAPPTGGAAPSPTTVSIQAEVPPRWSTRTVGPLGGAPIDLDRGPDGNLWYSNSAGLDRMTPAGEVTHVVEEPVGPMAWGADGHLWAIAARFGPFTTPATGKGVALRRISPAGTVDLVATLPDTFLGMGRPVADPAGAIVVPLGNTLQRIAADGTITAVDLGGAVASVEPDGDDLLVAHSGVIARVAPDGTATTIRTFPGALPFAGPDGQVWFVSDRSVYRLDPDVGAEWIYTTDTYRLTFVGIDESGRAVLRDDGSILRFGPSGLVAKSPLVWSAVYTALWVLALGPGDVVWAIDSWTPVVMRFDPDGTRTPFVEAVQWGATDLVAGPDGNLWFRQDRYPEPGKIVRLTPGGAVTVFSAPHVRPTELASGADGALWFANEGDHGIGRLTTSGVFTLFDDPRLVGARSLTPGPGGLVWFGVGGSVGTISSSGTVALHQVLEPGATGKITSLAVTGDGNVWFGASPGVPWIGRMSPTGTVTRFPVSFGGWQVLAAADGSVWFLNGLVNRLDPDGTVTSWSFSNDDGGPTEIAASPDAAVWVRICCYGQWVRALNLDHAPPAREPENEPGSLGPEGTIWYRAGGFFSSQPSNEPLHFTARTPSQPRPTAVATGDHEVTLSWRPPEVPNGTIHGYQVTSNLGPGCTTTGATSCTVTGLPTGERVLLYVEAVNLIGAGEPALIQPLVLTRFTDVPATGPFNADIEWMAEQGITTGYADGTFKPGAAVERQAMAAFLYRRAGSPNGATPTCASAPFTDVPTTNPFCGEVAWMKATGITTGFGDGSFHPQATVERQAMAAFLSRAHGQPPGPRPACSTPPFVDVAPTAPFCAEIQWMKAAGISTGNADGTYRPNEPVTRQAMAAFVHRLAALPPT